MFGINKSGANVYSQMSMETGVLAASPNKLTIMLYEGAITACRSAIDHMQHKDIQHKGEMLEFLIRHYELTKTFFWTPGSQMFNILIPVYLFYLLQFAYSPVSDRFFIANVCAFIILLFSYAFFILLIIPLVLLGWKNYKLRIFVLAISVLIYAYYPILLKLLGGTYYNFAIGYQKREKTPHPEQGLREAKIAAVLESSLEKYQSVAELANSSVYSKPDEPPTAAQLIDLENNIKSVRILCAYHGGELGVRKLNERIRKELGLNKPDSPGSLVMITRNDARVTNLSNGDVGLVVKDGLVWFPGKTVAIPFNQLPPNTPAFATTIHKSQGSEYTSVLLVLPKPDNNDDEDNREAFINKQLVFTGITRAKDNLTVFSTSDTLYDALDEPADRASGLDKRLC